MWTVPCQAAGRAQILESSSVHLSLEQWESSRVTIITATLGAFMRQSGGFIKKKKQVRGRAYLEQCDEGHATEGGGSYLFHVMPQGVCPP